MHSLQIVQNLETNRYNKNVGRKIVFAGRSMEHGDIWHVVRKREIGLGLKSRDLKTHSEALQSP